MAVDKNYDRIYSISELSSYTDRLISICATVGLDIETGYYGEPREKFSVHPETNFVVGFSFTNDTTWARYVPVQHDIGENLDRTESARLLWKLVHSVRIVCHNDVFELRCLAKWFRTWLSDDPEYGPAVRESNGYFPIFSDSMVEAYLCAEHKEFGLKFLTEAEFGHKQTELWELFPDLPKNKRDMIRFNILELNPEVIAYACEDALWSLAHHLKNYPKVKDMPLYPVEIELLQSICEMEDEGIQYDWEFMRRGVEEANLFLDKLNAEIQADLSAMTGEHIDINLNSPAQISTVLFDKLKMVTNRYTKSSKDKEEKKMSTDAVALEGLSQKHPVVKKILNWKELRKLIGTYLEAYEKKFNYAPDGRVHANYLNCAVITGRFACSYPNVQASPKKYHYVLDSGEEFNFNFRDAIIAPEDYYILGFDLSQAELRALAGEAGEVALIEAFANGEDVHSKTASLIVDVPLDEVTEDQRQDYGKRFNFALPYGLSVDGLKDRLGYEREEAQALYDKLTGAYPAISVYTDKQVQFGKKHGYVISTFGRRLPIWEYQSEKWSVRNKGDRACVNYPIQGSATGDYVRIVMVRARRALKEAGLLDRVRLVMNMHDALEYYVHRSVDPQLVVDILQKAVIFPVPKWPLMVADWHIGRKLGSMVKLGLDKDGKLVKLGAHVAPEPSPDESGYVSTGKSFESSTAPPIPVQETAQEEDQVESSVVAVRESGDVSSREVVVEMAHMPEMSAFQAFLLEAKNNPGNNTVRFKTPEGEIVLGIDPTRLSPSDRSQISLILGGANVYYAPDDVVLEDIVGDIKL